MMKRVRPKEEDDMFGGAMAIGGDATVSESESKPLFTVVQILCLELIRFQNTGNGVPDHNEDDDPEILLDVERGSIDHKLAIEE